MQGPRHETPRSITSAGGRPVIVRHRSRAARPMPKVLKHTLLSVRDLLVTAGPVPPARRRAAAASPTGCSTRRRRRRWCSPPAADQGAYAEFGKRYAAAAEALTASRSSCARPQGAAENLALLRDPHSGVDLAFVQGGADADAPATAEATTRRRDRSWSRSAACSTSRCGCSIARTSARAAAASRRRSTSLAQLRRLAGQHRRAAAAACRTLMDKLLDANGIDPKSLDAGRAQPQTPAVVELLDGQHRRAGLRLRARVADGADAAADAGHPALRLRPGRGVFAALPVHEPGDCCRAASSTSRATSRAHDVHLVAPTATLVARKAARIRRCCSSSCRRRKRIHGDAGWFHAQGRVPDAAQHRAAARRGGAALLPERPAGAAALPAVLARQPDRPHVAGAGVDRRGADPALAHAAAALRVPHPLAHLPLVRPAARDRGRRRSASARRASCCASSTSSTHASSASPCRSRYTDELYALRSHIHMVAAAPGRIRFARRDASETAMSERPRVVVVGCGFGGIEAVRALSKADGRDHAGRPHQPPPVPAAALPGGDRGPERRRRSARRSATSCASEMQRGNLTVLQGRGRRPSTRPRAASTLDDGERLAYDHLIVAAGATHSYFGHDEWAAHAPGLKTLADAFDIRAPRDRRLRARRARARRRRSAPPG